MVVVMVATIVVAGMAAEVITVATGDTDVTREVLSSLAQLSVAYWAGVAATAIHAPTISGTANITGPTTRHVGTIGITIMADTRAGITATQTAATMMVIAIATQTTEPATLSISVGDGMGARQR